MKRAISLVLCLAVSQVVAQPASGQVPGNPCEGYKPADLRSPLPFMRLEQCRARCMPRGRPAPSDAELQACIDGGTKPIDPPGGPISTAAAPVASSSFAADAEGWTGGSFPDGGPYDNVIARAPVRWNPGAGRSGSAISMNDPGLGNFFFEAPAAFLGNKQAFYGGQLRYGLRSEGGELFDEVDVILLSPGSVLVYRAPGRPSSVWSSMSVPLVESAWRLDRLAGRTPTRAEFERALATLTALRIRGEYRNGPETGSIDNVTLVPPAAAQSAASAPPPQPPTPAPVRAATETTRSAPTIARIVISDAADSSGRVSLVEKPALDRSAPKIFVTVQVADATRGTVVSVSLTYLGNNASLGPLTSEITADGNVMKAFSFTNSAKEWPVGSFRATATLADGTARAKDFTIK